MMPVDEGVIRCPSRIMGKVQKNGLLEVKCASRHCGAGKGTVVLHYFDLETRILVNTVKYREPQVLFQTKERGNESGSD